MTYDEVAKLFGEYERASTWRNPKNPQRFYFWARGRSGHRVAYYKNDDRKARYLWVPIEEVIEHVEPNGQTDSENTYYRLKKAAAAKVT